MFCIVLMSDSIAAVKPIVQVGVTEEKEMPTVKI